MNVVGKVYLFNSKPCISDLQIVFTEPLDGFCLDTDAILIYKSRTVVAIILHGEVCMARYGMAPHGMA